MMLPPVQPFTRATLLVLPLLLDGGCGPSEDAGPPAPQAGAATGDRAAAQPLLQQARAAADQQRLPDAWRLLDQALEHDPSFVEARWLRVQVLSQLAGKGNLPLALEDVQVVRAARPQDLDALAEEARIRDRLGQSRPTVDLLEEFVQASAGDAARADQRTWARATMGRLLLREGDPEAAEGPLREVEDEGRGTADTALGLARVARSRDDLPAWERWVDVSLRRAPLGLQARRERQQLLQRTGRTEEARREAQIQERIRVLVQDNSTRLSEDVPEQARLWGELAELLPGVDACRIRQVQLLARCEDDATLRLIGPGILADGLRHVDVIGLIALAQARGGQAAEALATAALLEECQPPPPPHVIQALRRQVRAIGSGG